MRTVFLAGHAKLPQGMAAQNMYEMLTITVEIDRTYGVIIETSCTLATEHARRYVSELLKGYSLRDGVEPLLEHIEKQYLGKAQQALKAAVKDLFQQYVLMYQKQ
ncbi:MAG: hypothetical protein BSOLF_0998 [Candidatus Carbobacillus altaicus]|uniref:DUF3870 domain-containing protein n=1 Tax=Candidatus Carbonibacillus altaicus TaxID=2163959 RepID=A0A2R6Y045_9BACL|nr:MAG: hypothetical protein BSOLF_0998 [Candidatus Carbobacillus altaicus]